MTTTSRAAAILESVVAPKEFGDELTEALMPQLDKTNRELTRLRTATAKRNVFSGFLSSDTKDSAVADLMAFQRLFGNVQLMIQDLAMSIGKVEKDTPEDELNKQLSKISDAALDAEAGMRKFVNQMVEGYRLAMTEEAAASGDEVSEASSRDLELIKKYVKNVMNTGERKMQYSTQIDPDANNRDRDAVHKLVIKHKGLLPVDVEYTGAEFADVIHNS